MSPRSSRILRVSLVVGALLAATALGVFTYLVGGPGMLLGMLRYDEREEGTLQVGDLAPDVMLTALDGATRVGLLADRGDEPLVLIFGSFT
jgi:hypothetical protein